MNKIVKTLTTSLLLLLMAVVLPACSDDDNPMDALAGKYTGTINSRVPAVPNFQGVDTPDEAVLTWTDKDNGLATIDLGGFTISIGEMGRGYEIGDMNITNVKVVAGADGSYTLSNDSFDCQAGQFEIKGGKLSGTYAADGTLTLTLTYKPGSMPMEVESLFKGQK